MKLLFWVTITLFLWSVESITSAGERYLGFWNVENLFDTHDDSLVQRDGEFTPGSDKQWTGERLQTKLQNLARVIEELFNTTWSLYTNPQQGTCVYDNRWQVID